MPLPVKTANVIFGWDASHYDGTLTRTILAKAVAEGIAFFTHKLGEGLGDADATAATALAAARDEGIQLLGGYWFIHGNDDAAASARACIANADAHEPWWRDFPGWFWQTDAETSSTGLPSPAYVKAFADELATLSGRTVLVYASHGMYGDRLAGVGHPLWNANYGTNPHEAFTTAYPGDNSPGWAPYSGQTPVILQYGSNTTIAGLTTCDANAYRGTVADFLTMIGAPMMQWTDQVVASGDPENAKWMVSGALGWQVAQLRTLVATTAADAKTDVAALAAIQALAAGNGNTDTAAIIAAINAAAAAESKAVAALQAQIAALQAKLAAAEQAAATALAAK